jgi:hypothetical protein
MKDPDIEIRYTFATSDGRVFHLPILLDRLTLLVRLPDTGTLPSWTDLDYQKCSHCPLRAATSPHCPAARAVVQLVEVFGEVLSYDTVAATVTLHDRTVVKETTVQRALSSILGLLMATSGCPQLAFLRPLARFHQPFATREETMFRATSAYLLGQYFKHQQGLPVDFVLTGLKEAYNALQIVNIGMARRLRGIDMGGDANVNAIVLLDLFAKELPQAIDENLHELAHLFQMPMSEQKLTPDYNIPVP